MCGITGIVNLDKKSVDKKVLTEMTRKLIHRGPDDEGFFIDKNVKKILAKGKTKCTIILSNGVQVDLRVVKPESWGAASLYFVGSKNYNIEMRKVAIKKGLKLSEYGLFDKSGKMIAGKTEDEVYRVLGMKYREPEEREV